MSLLQLNQKQQKLQERLNRIIHVSNETKHYGPKILILHQHIRHRKALNKSLVQYLYSVAPFISSLRMECKWLRTELHIRNDLLEQSCRTPDELFEHLEPNTSWIETRYGECRWHHYPILFCSHGIPGETELMVPFTIQLLRHLTPPRIDIDDLRRRGFYQGKTLSAGYLWLQPGDCFNHEAQIIPELLRERNHKIFIIHYQLVGRSEMHGDTTAFTTAHPLGAPVKRPEGTHVILEPGHFCVHNPSASHVLRCHRGQSDGSMSLYVYLEVTS